MQKTDSYKEHIEAKRARWEADTAARTELREAIDTGLRGAAAEAGVPPMPDEMIPAMRQLVMQTQDLAVGQVLVLGVYLMAMASEVIEQQVATINEAQYSGSE
jgi:hypothetical protein